MNYHRYIGTYPVKAKGGTMRFGCHVIASSFEDAQAKMDALQIEAKLDGVMEDAETGVPMPKDGGFEHWVIYLAFLAVSSGKYDARTILADNGIIHELMHLHEGVPTVGEGVLEDYSLMCKNLGLLPP